MFLNLLRLVVAKAYHYITEGHHQERPTRALMSTNDPGIHAVLSPAAKVADGLFLGSCVAAATLPDRAAVVNVTCHLPIFSPSYSIRVKVDDCAGAHLFRNDVWLAERTMLFIHLHRRSRPVLVHCFAGRSRSCAVVLLYLMWSCPNTYSTVAGTYAYVQTCRPCVGVNHSFIFQIPGILRTLFQRTHQVARV